MIIYYEDGESSRYNGTISQIRDNLLYHKQYYTYDKAGRLLTATDDRSSTLDPVLTQLYTYDRNSNITALQRMGQSAPYAYDIVDDLVMTYKGNQLVHACDAAEDVLLESSNDFHDGADNDVEYAYDDNGNVIRDDNRGITSISYNALNLPQTITFAEDQRIDNTYSASGVKLKREHSYPRRFTFEPTTDPFPVSGELPIRGGDLIISPILPPSTRVKSTRDYIGNYEKGLNYFRYNTPYGYFDASDKFHFYIRDYQGNIAMVMTKVTDGHHSLVQTNDYYPYGLPQPSSGDYQDNDYKFGGKEFDVFQKVNIYDFAARTYAPDEARFWQPDPRSGDYHWLSPYTYCAADPINCIDPNGEQIFFVDMQGQYITPEETGLCTSDLSMYMRDSNNYDRIIVIDKSGRTSVVVAESEKYEVGTIMPAFSGIVPPGKPGAYTCTEVKGDNYALEIFEFLAENITAKNGVEFGLNLMDDDPQNSRNDIISSYTKAKLPGLSGVYKFRKAEDRKFRYFFHSHRNECYPSESDMLSATSIAERLSKQMISPEFGLYVALRKTYIPYDYKQGYFINYYNRLEYTKKPIK